MDTEPVRIDKHVMEKLRKHIIRMDNDGKTYGKISQTVERAIEDYLSKVETENFVEELKNWMHDTDVETIDEVLEFLSDKGCLNDDGKTLRKNFWKKYIKR